MIKARNCITWANQYVAHRDVKRIRRDAEKEIEFGVETYNEIIQREEDSWIPAEVMFLVNSDEDFYIPE